MYIRGHTPAGVHLGGGTGRGIRPPLAETSPPLEIMYTAVQMH